MLIWVSLLILGAFNVLTAQISITPIPDALKPYISILKYGTPEYDAALRQLVPAASLPIASPLLPYSVIVHNASTEDLRGFQVVFRKFKLEVSGRPYAILSYTLDPAVPPEFPANGYRLLSPFFPLNDAIRSTSSPHNASSTSSLQDLNRRLPLADAAAELSREKAITVSVELIITPGGVVIGPDSLNSFSRITAERQAQVWLAGRLGVLSSSTARVAELQALSAQQISRAGGPFNMDFYNLKIQRDAKLLLRVTQAGFSGVIDDYITRAANLVQVVKQ